MSYHRTPGHHPKGEGDFRSDLLLETKAAYWEPRIKTYGFQKTTDVSLLEVLAPPSAASALGSALVQLGEEGIGFHLAFSRASASGFEFSLLVSRRSEKAVADKLGTLTALGVMMHRVLPAEIVFFQGPHFGDRYGIFHAAAEALAKKGILMLGCTCSGSCIYIVLPSGKSTEAVEALSEVFEIPRRQPSGTTGGAD